MIVYTIGHSVNYRRYLAEQGDQCRKAVGGSVWRTIREADHHRPIGYEVFEVQITDWDRDTVPNPEGRPWNDLLVEARIIEPVRSPSTNSVACNGPNCDLCKL